MQILTVSKDAAISGRYRTFKKGHRGGGIKSLQRKTWGSVGTVVATRIYICSSEDRFPFL